MRGQDRSLREHAIRHGIRRHRLRLAVVVVALGGMLVPAAAARADGNNTCKFDTFPNAPGGSSELAVGCFLTSAIGGAGNKYVIEDFPQAHWHTGAARTATASAANAVGGTAGTCVSSTDAHFLGVDINNGISGAGIPSNTFINAIGPATSGTPACVAGQARISANLAAGAIAMSEPLLIDNSDGRTIADATFSGATMTSPTGHFCKTGLPNCGSKSDIGKTLQGTQLSHLATITGVTSNTVVTVSPSPAASCPTGVPVADCKQVSLNLPAASPATTTRQVKDATFVAPNKVCSGTALFAAKDVQLAITSGLVTGSAPQKFPAGDYITAVGATGCPAGTTEATLHANFITAGTNANVVIGVPNVSAPANGTTVAQLNSELSVNPTEAPGEPACTSGILSGSALAGEWNNPGSFDAGALGSATDVNQQTATSPPALGSMIGQIDYVTGQANLAAYVVQVKASTPHETDTAAHYDIYFPLLLTGVAVCPNTSGVASTFRFNGQSLLSQVSGQPGDVRDLTDFPTGTKNGTAVEHIYQSTTSKLNVTSTNCAISYPAVNGYTCGGN
jgi:hypothetical protein